MQKFLVAIFAAVLTAFSLAPLSAEEASANLPSWRLVYAHDEEGAAVEGSKDELMQAVRNGKPVRVYFAGRTVEHAAEAFFLTIFEGEVFAQIEQINSQRPSRDPAKITFREPGQEWHMIIGTNGYVSALMDGSEPNERTNAARWFVQD